MCTCFPKEPSLIEAAGEEDRGLGEGHEEITDCEVDNEHVGRCPQASAPARIRRCQEGFPEGLSLPYPMTMHVHIHIHMCISELHVNICTGVSQIHMHIYAHTCASNPHVPSHMSVQTDREELLGHRPISLSSRCLLHTTGAKSCGLSGHPQGVSLGLR